MTGIIQQNDPIAFNLNGLLACSDVGGPAGASSTVTPTAATIYLRKIPVLYTTTFTSVIYQITTAAVGNSNTQIGLYSSAGTYLTATADISTVVQSAGTKTTALAAATAVTGGPTTFVWLGVHFGVQGGTSGVLRAVAAGGFNWNVGVSAAVAGTYAGHATNTLATIGNLTPGSITALSTAAPMFGVI